MVAAVCAGVTAGIMALAALLHYQRRVWQRALAEPLIIGDDALGSQ